LSVPQGATITYAELRLTSAGFTAGGADFDVMVENTSYANRINSSIINSLSNRPTHAQSVAWNDVPEILEGNSLSSPNIASLVSSVVSSASWINGALPWQMRRRFCIRVEMN